MAESQGSSGPKRRAPNEVSSCTIYAATFFTLSIQLTIPRAKRLATSHHRLEVESEDSAQVLRKVPVAVILLDDLFYFR